MVLYDDLGGWNGAGECGGREAQEGSDIYEYIELIHFII